MLEADGKDVLHARGWRIERPAREVPEVRDHDSARAQSQNHEVPEAGDGLVPPIFEHAPDGYLSMIEWRFMSSGPGETAQPESAHPESASQKQVFAGPAVSQDEHGLTAELRYVWTRPRLPLILGEEPTPMSRALLVADSGSGVGAALPASGFIFINVDLSVVLPRDPRGSGCCSKPRPPSARTVPASQPPGFLTSTARSAGPGRPSWSPPGPRR